MLARALGVKEQAVGFLDGVTRQLRKRRDNDNRSDPDRESRCGTVWKKLSSTGRPAFAGRLETTRSNVRPSRLRKARPQSKSASWTLFAVAFSLAKATASASRSWNVTWAFAAARAMEMPMTPIPHPTSRTEVSVDRSRRAATLFRSRRVPASTSLLLKRPWERWKKDSWPQYFSDTVLLT